MVAPSLPPPAPVATAAAELETMENDPLRLAEQITAKAHALAPGNKDLALAELARSVVKSSFDRALQSEVLAFPHLSTLLQSLDPSSGPTTRSAASRPAPTKATLKLNLTPLLELTVEEMDPEMVWEQMEMRNKTVVELLKEMFGADNPAGEDDEGEDGDGMGEDEDEMDDEDDDDEGSEDDESEDDSEGVIEFGEDPEVGGEEDGESEDGFEEHEEYYRKLGEPGVGVGGADNVVPGESSDEEETEDPMADATKDLTLSTFDLPGSGRPQKRAPGPPSAVDDTFFSLHDFHVAADEGEAEMERALRRGAKDDDSDDEGGDGEGGEDELDLFRPVGPSGKKQGGEMDDDSEEDEVDLGEDKPIMYSDFFDPPPAPYLKGGPKGKGKADDRSKGKKGKGVAPPALKSPTKSKTEPAPSASTSNGTGVPEKTLKLKRSVRFSDKVKVKTIAARGSEFDKLVERVGFAKAEMMLNDAQTGKGTSEEEEAEDDGMPMEDEDVEMEDAEEDESSDEDGEEDEEEDEEEEGSDVEEGLETIERLKSSLFDEESEDEATDASPAASLSRHERRLLALSSQIAALEAENVGVKDWATKGEAKARDRPVNSLLEEDLEYERSGKVVPVITEETTKTIEDLIKKRILENQFDDVLRQRPIDPNAFLPSRFMELQDVKSNKSLAEIYEEDYTTAKEKEAGRQVTHELDADLEKKHAEIEELFEELSSKLDALSNARFTPKPPKATITTITNLPAITLESALPTTTSVSTLLAPEEVYVPDPSNEDRSDFTPAMKKTARQKRRKARAAMAKSAEKFSKGAKGEKERATKMLVGTSGVTVIGKGGKAEVGKKRKRGDEDDGGRSGVSLKL